MCKTVINAGISMFIIIMAPVCVKKIQNSEPAVKRSRTFTNVHDRSQTFTNVQRFFRVKTFVDGVDDFLGLSVCHLTFDV